MPFSERLVFKIVLVGIFLQMFFGRGFFLNLFGKKSMHSLFCRAFFFTSCLVDIFFEIYLGRIIFSNIFW